MTKHSAQLWSILLAAGQGSRLAGHTNGLAKQFLAWQDLPLYWQSIRTLAAIPALQGIVVVFPAHNAPAHEAQMRALESTVRPGIPLISTLGGARRQDSVQAGLLALPTDCTQVLIHDSARPFFSATLVTQLLKGLTPEISGLIPACPVTDTIKIVHRERVCETPDRATLQAVQTPQLFWTKALRTAHAEALAQGWEVTDDASMLERADLVVQTVPGEEENRKITTAKDLSMLTPPPCAPEVCTGFGYDVHAYGGTRPLVLGGIPIAGAPAVKAHSDGDVLLHALSDALLGCAGLGDIGEHFPDSDPQLDNISSAVLLTEILQKTKACGVSPVHADLTIIAQTPRLTPHKKTIRRNVALLLNLKETSVNIKATTEEHLGFTGRKEGIKAVATVTAIRTRG